MPDHLLIWGATPLAGWLAASLAPAQSVTWLTDPPMLDAIRKGGGWRVDDEVYPALNIITDIKEARQPDLILLASSAWYTASALRILSTFKNPPPVVVLQMGVGGFKQVENALGGDQTLVGVVTRPLNFTEPLDRGSIEVGRGGGVALQADHRLSHKIAGLLRGTGLKLMFGSSESIQWSSVVWGIQANALSTILNSTTDYIYTHPTWFAYEHRQLVEALIVIRKLGVSLMRLPGVNVPRLAGQVAWLPPHLVHHFLRRYPRPPSLSTDLRLNLGRSDAAYLNGAVAIHADQINLRTPVNHALALTVTDIAEGRALWSQYQRLPNLLEATLRLAID